MCGIVGYVGIRDAASLILDGLQRLEYRGYDSAGIAVLDGAGCIAVRRDVGKLVNLRGKLDAAPLDGSIGIGHTRWATHGAPAEHNAHPHVSMYGDFVVVHNGIVENYLELRAELIAQGVTFRSETDTEVIAHLIESYAHNGARGDMLEATRRAVKRLKGAQAIVVMSRAQPNALIAVRTGSAGGVALGLGEGENYVASDIPAILEHTRRIVFLEDRQLAIVTRDAVHVETLEGQPLTPTVHDIAFDSAAAAKGEYQHFMQKEIHEQARAVTDTLAGRVDWEHGVVYLDSLNLTAEHAQALTRLVTVACGTSYYSGLVGKFYIERFARLPVEVDYASEYRYRQPILDPHTAVLAITQSGETVDTLAAIDEARRQNATVWSIVNAIGSQAMRIADGHIAMNAGPEIGVASTKAYTTSVVDQYLLALHLAHLRGTLDESERRAAVHDLALLPNLIGEALAQAPHIERLAETLLDSRDFLFLGRGVNYPTALEGALKLKEISYLHAEGYPAGEMKHGPIALIDDKMPVVTVALQDSLYDKMLSQIEQVKARGGRVIAVGTAGDRIIAEKADAVIWLPPMPELLSPIVAVVALQLLAYYVSVKRGNDVDQPRNLAKSVTVE